MFRRADTYDLLRRATNPVSREAWTDAILVLVEKYGLDGVDFDWEYLNRAPDLLSILIGRASDEPHYFTTLGLLRDKLPYGKSLSINGSWCPR
ncbi:hypothetical protein BKA66DRAFT_434956 [Pyrenochaeta sp. MPI-SDFR-AT-0127]|nr:hypothetical protein BKA66DRAFT_434956 [Pyrenochaeta sp. MPI-SDFR-AT-0127]